MLPLRELLALRLCKERPLMWLDGAEPSDLLSWKNFSLSACFAGGGGIATAAVFSMLFSCFCSVTTGLIRGRCSISPGTADPSKPKGRSTLLPSSSGCNRAFPFLILSSRAYCWKPNNIHLSTKDWLLWGG